MRINSGLLFWGLTLITAGAVALAASQGIIDRDWLAGAWRLWPVILIAIGLSIVLSRTPFWAVGTVAAALVIGIAGGALLSVGPGVVSCGDAPADTTTSSGEFTLPQATVHLQLDCGELNLDLADGSGWAATGIREGEPAQLEAGDGSLDIRSESGGFPFSRDRQAWGVTLGTEVSYDLSASLNAADSRFDLAGGTFTRIAMDPNAGSVDIDLSGAQVGDLQVQLNAGSLSLLTDGETDVVGVIGVNAGAVDFCAPPGAALRFTVNANVTFSHNLEDSDLVADGDIFSTPGFATAERKMEIRLEGNAASFDLNPEEGCA